MNLDTIYTAGRIEAGLQPAKLESARQAQDASRRVPGRSLPVRQLGSLLSQVGARLQGMPDRVCVDAPPAKPGSALS